MDGRTQFPNRMGFIKSERILLSRRIQILSLQLHKVRSPGLDASTCHQCKTADYHRQIKDIVTVTQICSTGYSFGFFKLESVNYSENTGGLQVMHVHACTQKL